MNDASHLVFYRHDQNGRRIALKRSAIGSVEDVTENHRGAAATQIQYPMANGAKFVVVRDAFDEVLRRLGITA